jgi:hypothetical protein
MEFDSAVAGPARYRSRSANGTFVPVRLSLHVPRRRTPVQRHLPTVRDDEFLVQTFKFEGTPDTVSIEYMWFEDIGGRPSWASRPVRLPDIEARHALLSPGMGRGAAEGYALAGQRALVAVTALRRCQLEHVQPHRRIRRLVPSIDVGANSAVVKHEGRCCTTSWCIAARAGSGAKASRVLRFM